MIEETLKKVITSVNDSVIETRKQIINYEKERNINDNYKKIIEFKKKLKHLENIIEKYDEFSLLLKQVKEIKEEISNTPSDSEMYILFKEEAEELKSNIEKKKINLYSAIVPINKDDSKNIIVEMRGATGGDEANIFVGDLMRMYFKFAEKNNWTYKVINSSPSKNNGFSSIEFSIEGKNVYKKMKYESGIHRVQRIPLTESKGRVHTSTVSIAILPQATKLEVNINTNDLRIDTYRSSGAGGQHVNKTDSAIRITHIPTGIVCASQNGRSQHSNKLQAMEFLYAKLYAQKQYEEKEKIQKERKKAIMHGYRSEKIRTYNFPQNRITDHRIPLSINNLTNILAGDIGFLIKELIIFFQNERIKNFK